jgi:hypothetical protein
MLKRITTIPNQTILFALIAADLMFIFLHILHILPENIFPFFKASAFAIDKDAGIAESFQYIKELWITMIFIWLVFQRRYTLLGLALLFAYFLLDDMVQIHEKLGDMTAGLFANLQILRMFPNQEADSFGELFSAGMLGLVFIVAIFLFYQRSDDVTRQIYRTVFAMLGIFLFFAVGVDFIHDFFGSRIIRAMFALVEDGGEMLAMSIICWFSCSLLGEFKRRDAWAEEDKS